MPQNQLGAESNDSGDAAGRTGDNDTNYDGGRPFDASGTSTPAYRQEDGESSIVMLDRQIQY